MNMLYEIILDLKKEQECVGDVAGAAFEHPFASTLLTSTLLSAGSTGLGSPTFPLFVLFYILTIMDPIGHLAVPSWMTDKDLSLTAHTPIFFLLPTSYFLLFSKLSA